MKESTFKGMKTCKVREKMIGFRTPALSISALCLGNVKNTATRDAGAVFVFCRVSTNVVRAFSIKLKHKGYGTMLKIRTDATSLDCKRFDTR